MSASSGTRSDRASRGKRLASAVRRRLRYVWSRLRRRGRRPPVEAALDWLLALEVDGSLTVPNEPWCADPGLTGECIGTAASLGCRAEGARWARWLISLQRDDGSLPGSATTSWQGVRPYPVDHGNDRPVPSCPVVTAQAAKGFLALAGDLPEFVEPARRACGYLRSLFDECGRVRPASEDHWIARAELLPVLPALWQASQRWDDQAYHLPAIWGVEVLINGCGEAGYPGPGFPFPCSSDAVHEVEVLVEMGRMGAAAQLMERIRDCQRRDGSIPELAHGPGMPPKHALTWSSTTARAAALWCRLGDRERADRAMRYLERRQRRDGSLLRDPRGWIRARGAPDAWAVKYYLDAALLRVRAAFEARWRDFPDWIEPADGRVQAVRRWFEAFPQAAKVADIGCGNGRFLKHLVEWFPDARLTGIDISPAMLAQLPSGVETREGSILRIPAADGEFDGAFAVESLEHSLVPRRAIAEICRTVRPGGTVLVIDKHRAKQAFSEHDPWERWFLPEELNRWLSRFCEGVTIEPVSHSQGRGGRDLFLAAQGRRKIEL